LNAITNEFELKTVSVTELLQKLDCRLPTWFIVTMKGKPHAAEIPNFQPRW